MRPMLSSKNMMTLVTRVTKLTCNIRGGCGATLTASLTLRDRIGACVSVPPTFVGGQLGDDVDSGDGGEVSTYLTLVFCCVFQLDWCD